MSELFTPTTEQVSQAYEVAHEETGAPMEPGEFWRWLDQVRREAKAAAIRDAAAELFALDPIGDAVMWNGQGYVRVYDWLLDRAKQIEEGNHDHV